MTTTSGPRQVAVVVPALNEATTIAAVVAAAAAFGRVIVVDDGSHDDTGALAAAAGAEVVRHGTNRGYDAALTSGFCAAIDDGVDAVVTIDADAQHEPANIAAVLAPLGTGTPPVRLVVGRRPAAARLTEAAFSGWTRLRFGLPDILCGLKAYDTGILARYLDAAATTSYGTAVTLAALRDHVPYAVVDVAVRDRADAPRVGGRLRGELRIGRAFAEAVVTDATAVTRIGLGRLRHA